MPALTDKNTSRIQAKITRETRRALFDDSIKQKREMADQASWIIEQYYKGTEEPKLDSFTLFDKDRPVLAIEIASALEYDGTIFVTVSHPGETLAEIAINKADLLNGLAQLRERDPSEPDVAPGDTWLST